MSFRRLKLSKYEVVTPREEEEEECRVVLSVQAPNTLETCRQLIGGIGG
jgi:hypothetical protein